MLFGLLHLLTDECVIQIHYSRREEGLRFVFGVKTCEQVTVRGDSNAKRTVILFASRILSHFQLSKNNPSSKSW